MAAEAKVPSPPKATLPEELLLPFPTDETFWNLKISDHCKRCNTSIITMH